MERRFPHDQRQMMLGQNLVPSKLANLNDTIQDELFQVYSPDLPDVNTWKQEVNKVEGLRRLKTWERSTMSEERLCGLAMLHTHRDKDVSREDILLRFDRTGHRRIGKLTFD
ncbi:Hypothetical predicted protein [Mytilus galloprovincialis]|uniref:Uncharacterized protein n=1 Tax=Mytilus galloprovincialis TaxID=29158 RepID=A0A8B6CUR5_MYTGA|nr:Hypothetical predicted protein [Mytilus galloprovincialis]